MDGPYQTRAGLARQCRFSAYLAGLATLAATLAAPAQQLTAERCQVGPGGFVQCWPTRGLAPTSAPINVTPASAAGLDPRVPQLAADVGRLREELAAVRAVGPRLDSIEAATRRHHLALAQAIERIEGLAVANGRAVARVEELDDAAASDRAKLEERIRAAAAPVVVAAIKRYGLSAGAAVAIEGAALSGPVGLGVLAAGWLVSRAIKRRASDGGRSRVPFSRGERATQSLDDTPADVATVTREVVYQTPPPPQIVRTDTRHHVVEGDNLEARAWEFAMKEMVEREPATLPLVNRLKSFKSQWLSGERMRDKQK